MTHVEPAASEASAPGDAMPAKAQRHSGRRNGDAITARTRRCAGPIGQLGVLVVVGSTPSSRKMLSAHGSETYTTPAPALPAVRSNLIYPTTCHAASSLNSVSGSDKRCLLGRFDQRSLLRPQIMTQFIAIKVNYDHREELASHLKYTTVPTLAEYTDYLTQFKDERRGGNGFHECLNFAIPDSNPVKIYIPPTCLPAKSKIGEEFVIFSFTYKGDKYLSSHIIGVHARVKILSNEAYGLPRSDVPEIDGIESLHYHAEAPGDFVTLLLPPVPYDDEVDVFTPHLKRWGYGLRYITEENAENILSTALSNAKNALLTASLSEEQIISREVAVLNRIASRYSLSITSAEKKPKAPKKPKSPAMPDIEIGHLGERIIYEKELEYVKSIGCKPSEVEWISQSDPISPFDIKSLRQEGDTLRPHFIEVKSSSAADVNVYISSGQIEFFKAHEPQSTFMFVKFDFNRNLLGITELTLADLNRDYDLVPIKFKLANRATKAA